MIDVDRKNSDVADGNGSDRHSPAATGRDIVAALASFPAAEVKFDRLSFRPKVRDIDLSADVAHPRA
jgi:hypothetical protein